ncbi:MFS transporter [Rhodococcus fascians]|nr:MFS transporter [Rhodococcus fascians]MBY3997802.1 MFS transporter [Rhodococcus fascians]MBY4002815.1 MFS transporter [Rhodococcus fascians]MBY4006806.1 MFS transporter [Rhodococcus fascians]MBY4019413.1 MFS transporter [Rhodococcus fascians]
MTTVNEQPPRIDFRQARWSRIGVPLFVTYFICFMDRTNISVASPHLADELQLSAAAMGVVFSAFFWGYVVSGVPAGAWANKGHAKTIIVVCMVIIGLSAGLTGVVHNYPVLLAARIVLGLAEGAIFPAFAVMFISWFPSRERGLAVAMTMYTVPLSAAVMAPLSGWLIELTSWRAMFIIQAVPAILVAAWLHFSVHERPEDAPNLSADERDYILATRTKETTDESTLLQVFVRPTVWLLAIVYFFWAMGIYALTLWLPTVIGDLTGSGSLTVGLLTAVPFLCGTAAMYLLTKWAVASGRSLGYFIAPAIAVSGGAMVVQHFVHLGGVFSFAMLVIAAGSIYAALALWWTWVMQIVPRNQAGASVGFINLSGNLGGLVGPLLIGLVATAGNTASGFWIVGVGILFAAALIMLVDAHRTRSQLGQDSVSADPQRHSVDTSSEKG